MLYKSGSKGFFGKLRLGAPALAWQALQVASSAHAIVVLWWAVDAPAAQAWP
eukprot:gene10276-13800_t